MKKIPMSLFFCVNLAIMANTEENESKLNKILEKRIKQLQDCCSYLANYKRHIKDNKKAYDGDEYDRCLTIVAKRQDACEKDLEEAEMLKKKLDFDLLSAEDEVNIYTLAINSLHQSSSNIRLTKLLMTCTLLGMGYVLGEICCGYRPAKKDAVTFTAAHDEQNNYLPQATLGGVQYQIGLHQ